jgi:hypothetical protein
MSVDKFLQDHEQGVRSQESCREQVLLFMLSYETLVIELTTLIDRRLSDSNMGKRRRKTRTHLRGAEPEEVSRCLRYTT